MKKYFTILLYALFLLLGLALYYSDKLSDFADRLAASDQSVLMAGFNILATYFQAADTWNWIFVILAIATALDSYVLIDLGLGWLIKKIFTRKRSTPSEASVDGALSSDKESTRPAWFESVWFKMFVQKAISLTVLFVLFVAGTNLYVSRAGATHSKGSPTEIDAPKPTLVLGTSKMLSSGAGENLYYTYRINTAVELWAQGKVDYFIISGDGTGEGHQDDYDEIRDMTNDLVARGVPQEKIKQDTAGYRTLDSMLRIRQLFCTKELVIVSQNFHVARAIVLAGFYGIKAIGMPSAGSETLSMARREIFSSKPKLMLDILFANMQPEVSVESTCMKNQSYRPAFAVKSDLHIILMVLLGVGFISSLGLLFKYMG